MIHEKMAPCIAFWVDRQVAPQLLCLYGNLIANNFLKKKKTNSEQFTSNKVKVHHTWQKIVFTKFEEFTFAN